MVKLQWDSIKLNAFSQHQQRQAVARSRIHKAMSAGAIILQKLNHNNEWCFKASTPRLKHNINMCIKKASPSSSYNFVITCFFYCFIPFNELEYTDVCSNLKTLCMLIKTKIN